MITFDDIKPLVVEIVGTDIIDPEKDTFITLGMDSLDALDLILRMEGKFDVSIPSDNFNYDLTINEWLAKVNESIKSK